MRDYQVACWLAQIAEMKVVSEGNKAEQERLIKAANLKAQEASDARAEIDNIKREAAVQAAAGKHGFYDADDIARLTSDAIKYDAALGRYVVIGEGDQPKLNAEMEPMTLDEFYADYAAKHKFYVKSDFRGGTGSTVGGGTGFVKKYTPADVFGSKAIPGLYAKLSKENPAEYKRVRAEAVLDGTLAA